MASWRKSFMVASRRTSPSRMNGQPYTELNTMWLPPMCTLCAGLRACTSNSRGAFATCSSTNSGSRYTTSPSTRWPALANSSDAPGLGDLDADRGKNPPPAAIQDRDRVRGEDLIPRHRVHEHRLHRAYSSWGLLELGLRGPSARGGGLTYRRPNLTIHIVELCSIRWNISQVRKPGTEQIPGRKPGAGHI